MRDQIAKIDNVVSTHSRTKAAAICAVIVMVTVLVSTHSRTKAAALYSSCNAMQ